MYRKLNMTKEKFLTAYNEAERLTDVEDQLNISRNSLRYYIRKYQLKTSPPKSIEKHKKQEQIANEVFLHYRGLRTVNDIVYTYGLSRGTVKNYIRNGIKRLYQSENKPVWPPPTCLQQIKIVKLLIECDQNQFYRPANDIDQVILNTGVSRKVAEHYFERTSELRAERGLWQMIQDQDKHETNSPINQLKELCRPTHHEITTAEEKANVFNRENLSPVDQLRTLIGEQQSSRFKEGK